MFKFNKIFKGTEEDEETIFDIDLSKGLYIGAGVELNIETSTIVKPIYISWSDLAGHFSVFGTTRVGKTRLMVSLIRQCIQRGMDILVVEPKGSLGQETIAWVLQFTQEANRLRDYKYISPMFPDLSVKFNPLYGLSNEEIASLVSDIIPAKDEFFSAIGFQITMAILLGLEFLEAVEGGKEVKNIIKKEYQRVFSGSANIINEVCNLSDPDLATRVVLPTPGQGLDLVDPPYRSIVTFADLATYSTHEGITAIYGYVEKITVEQYSTTDIGEINKLNVLKGEALRALREQAEKDKGFFSKVGSSFNIILQQLSTGMLGEVLCSTKINPVMDGYRNKEHGQILVLQPFPLIFKQASTAFVRIFFAMFTAAYGNIGAAGRGFPREICLFIDEGGAVLYPGVESLFNKAGGLGLRIFIFSQSFADYDDALGKDVSKIVNDNTNIKLYLKMNDAESRAQIQNSFGKVRIASAGYAGSKLDLKVQINESEKDLLISAHIADMKKQEFLLQYQDGRYICCAPSQPDPDYWIDAPKLDIENISEEYSQYMYKLDTEELDKAEKI
jgi:hypothetical protein